MKSSVLNRTRLIEVGWDMTGRYLWLSRACVIVYEHSCSFNCICGGDEGGVTKHIVMRAPWYSFRASTWNGVYPLLFIYTWFICCLLWYWYSNISYTIKKLCNYFNINLIVSLIIFYLFFKLWILTNFLSRVSHLTSRGGRRLSHCFRIMSSNLI